MRAGVTLLGMTAVPWLQRPSLCTSFAMTGAGVTTSGAAMPRAREAVHCWHADAACWFSSRPMFCHMRSFPTPSPCSANLHCCAHSCIVAPGRPTCLPGVAVRSCSCTASASVRA